MQQFVTFDDESDDARSESDTTLTADTALAVEALCACGLGAAHQAVAAGIHWLWDHRLQRARAWENDREMATLLRALAGLQDPSDHATAPLLPEIQLVDSRSLRTDSHASGQVVPKSRLRQVAERITAEFVVRQQSDGGWSTGSGNDCWLRSHGVVHAIDRRPTFGSSPDATGALLEALSSHGLPSEYPAVGRGAAYLRASQRGDGSWDSATGLRFLHGTSWAIRGLIAAGAAASDPAIAAGVNWLLVEQQLSGGWGECVAGSADDQEFIAADATALQTAWAILALVAAGHAHHAATLRGVEFLIDAQRDDGRWCDAQLTIRDSAAGMWYRNEFHSAAMPLMALARWAVAAADLTEEMPVFLRLVSDNSPG